MVFIPPEELHINIEFYLTYIPLINDETGRSLNLKECNGDFSNKPCMYLLPVTMSMERIIQLTYPAEIMGLVHDKVVSANKLMPIPDIGAYPPIYLSAPSEFKTGEVVILPSYP